MPTETREDRERVATFWWEGAEWPLSVRQWVEGTRENPGVAANTLPLLAALIASVREAAYRAGVEAAAKVCDAKAAEADYLGAGRDHSPTEWIEGVADDIRALCPAASEVATASEPATLCTECKKHPAAHVDVEVTVIEGTGGPCCGGDECCAADGDPSWSIAPLAKGGE